MLPFRMRAGQDKHSTRTAVDAKLMERTGLDEVSVRRLRKEFMLRCNRLTYKDWCALSEGGTTPRFTLMVGMMREIWPGPVWQVWLRYLEHTEQDICEMCQGDYPISPYLVRQFSALFGIKVDFLLMGAAPSVDKRGANIDILSATGIY